MGISSDISLNASLVFAALLVWIVIRYLKDKDEEYNYRYKLLKRIKGFESKDKKGITFRELKANLEAVSKIEISFWSIHESYGPELCVLTLDHGRNMYVVRRLDDGDIFVFGRLEEVFPKMKVHCWENFVGSTMIDLD